MNFKGFFLLLFSVISLNLMAQVPSDMSNVKASQISNAQLREFLNRAKSSGLSQAQLEAEFTRRGLPATEMEILRQRISDIESGIETADETTSVDSTGADGTNMRANTKRQVAKSNNRLLEIVEDINDKKPKIFGSELFANANLSFEPDLRMATPKNYTIGPDDELLLNIYGLNISQQTLKVTPEGTVNVKYAGVINVSGLTVDVLTTILKNRLTRYYPGLSSGQTKMQLTLGNIRSIRVILIGAIKRPGTYSLPSLVTLFNALYASGGPAENGSFRNIELIRNNQVIQTADLYDFLVRGNQLTNVRLEDNDVIRVPFATLLVTLTGQLNRSGIFELKADENLDKALEYAGGFKSYAFRGRLTGSRITGYERRIVDVSGDSLAYFKPHNGDEFVVDSVINRFQNRVQITGAVFKPGSYALENGMSLKQLISKAYGLREDVYNGRAIVVRKGLDLVKEYISVDLKAILNGRENGLTLFREDSIHVASIFDLRDTAIVTINGAVRKPGIFRFEEGLTLKSLIMKAEGFADDATGTGIEISRRKRDINVNAAGSDIVQIIKVNDTLDLSSSAADITLMPFDIVAVKENPFYQPQISVKVSGEVLSPSTYSLQSREERLSSLINRAGGLLYTANIAGAKLVRQKKDLADSADLKRLFRSLENDSTKSASAFEMKKATDVAIDLAYILKHPGSADDITLEEGDELIVPRINNTVSIGGEVFKPLDIMYEKGKSMDDYISAAGGNTPSGSKKRAFVIYANGSAAKIKKPLGIFRSYPKITPGASIFVPQKPKREGFDVGKAGIFISAITALITAATLITR
ncbi:SLBB domain-containing protein [Terrimonas sp. NA20]|uniref:SLBB domain-containing protein n=1 Tax=Terrimonas ginsenosidimutans TaxID=2908004 RepID=A0ABS9KUP0_9BACT|nr:SLBB domain-containing protein [Terrimonas ginsenosidimutans]MCG2616064.1 SLBB domain-containing protein [Terrimonas ginsenosidimutans]